MKLFGQKVFGEQVLARNEGRLVNESAPYVPGRFDQPVFLNLTAGSLFITAPGGYRRTVALPRLKRVTRLPIDEYVGVFHWMTEQDGECFLSYRTTSSPTGLLKFLAAVSDAAVASTGAAVSRGKHADQVAVWPSGWAEASRVLNSGSNPGVRG